MVSMSAAEKRLGLSKPLRTIVREKFHDAVTAKNLLFSETHLVLLHNRAGVPFQFRYCPALANKPKAPPPSPPTDPPKKKFDPFEDPTDLLVTRIPDQVNYTHNIVLNKYPVIQNHFILATRENKPQLGLLEEIDLLTAYDCLQAWRDGHIHDDDENSGGNKHSRRDLYSFFNSGPDSGASQKHRHIQFQSIEDLLAQQINIFSQSTKEIGMERPWRLLVNQMTEPAHEVLPLFHDSKIPCLHFSTPLTPTTVYEKYLLLVRSVAAVLSSHKHKFDPIGLEQIENIPVDLPPVQDPPNFSYNLSLTLDRMTILPRRAEDAFFHLPPPKGPPPPEGSPQSAITDYQRTTGDISINGTVLAGTLMVKGIREWGHLRESPELINRILEQVGYEVDRGHKTSLPANAHIPGANAAIQPDVLTFETGFERSGDKSTAADARQENSTSTNGAQELGKL